MASRAFLQQQNRVEGGATRQKNMVGAGGRTRRALGDIGNVVTTRAVAEGKPLPNVHRPITRSFGAQLLANAKAAAEAENNKKCVPVNVAAAGAGKVKKPAVKRNVVKPKAEVIEISSDSDNSGKEESSSKKKAPTLTSTLTARSKAACGLSNRPLKVVDIDAADVSNELAVTEYVDELYRFYKVSENESRIDDYMDSQPEMDDKMRAILIDWLTEVHHKFELSPETLYLTINVIDRYLSVKATPRKDLQLVGMGAMLVASKYEEIWAPEVNDLVCISYNAYTHAQVLAMEKRILSALQWNLTVPTAYVFLVRFIKASVADSDMESTVYFLAELGMMSYATSVHYCPSMLAASAVYAARCTLEKTPVWDETLKLYTGFTEAELVDCAKLLVSYHSKYADHKLKVVFNKYSNADRRAVALLSPAKSLLCRD